jgi:hypothetical protein
MIKCYGVWVRPTPGRRDGARRYSPKIVDIEGEAVFGTFGSDASGA